MPESADPLPGNWHFTAWQGSLVWIGLAKQEPFVNGHPIHEPGDVWFEFGYTPEEAIENVRRSLIDATYHSATDLASA